MRNLVTVPRWERYRDFFRLTILRYLVVWFSVVPFVYTLLSGLPQPLPIELGGKVYAINFELPFSWQVLWLSSLAYFLALLLYLWRCPAFVKRYNTFSNYRAHGHDPRWLAWETKRLIEQGDGIEKFVKRMTTKEYLQEYEGSMEGENPEVQKHTTTFRFEHEGKIWELAMPRFTQDGVDEEAERAIFWEIFGRFSECRWFARTTICVLLFVSGALFLLVLGEHIFAGWSAAEIWLADAIWN